MKKNSTLKKKTQGRKKLAITQVKTGPNASLILKIAEEKERRKLITKFISEHMKEGIDYGQIEMVGKDGKKYLSKPSLFKPGSEKFCSLLHLRPTFQKDSETWEMMGEKAGLVCYLCQLLGPDGEIVGEGRGAANIEEKKNWTINNAIKIAEKRAQIDAVLRSGGLSDFFTQDLEDIFSSDGGSRKVSRNIGRVDPETVVFGKSGNQEKCPYCSSVGRFHKPGCPGAKQEEPEKPEEAQEQSQEAEQLAEDADKVL